MIDNLLLDLALQIVKDGEGAKKLITISVKNAKNYKSAKHVGFSIANSLLVKTTLGSKELNFGRIFMAIGKSYELINQDKVSFSIGNFPIVKEGKLSNDRLENINQRTRDGGAEIVKFLEKGSAFYAPAASGVEMASAYLYDRKKMLPCATYLSGEYGIKGIYAGVPVIIGKNGVEKIEEISLDDNEKKEFMNSIDSVKKLWKAASSLDPSLSK